MYIYFHHLQTELVLKIFCTNNLQQLAMCNRLRHHTVRDGQSTRVGLEILKLSAGQNSFCLANLKFVYWNNGILIAYVVLFYY